MTIDELIADAEKTLKLAGIQEPLLEARSLLAYSIKRDRTFLFAHPEFELDSSGSAEYRSLIIRRQNREPFQYIVGRQEFYCLDFEVSPDVLIPRPETEILVEAAVDAMKQLESPNFIEIGAGSGCISVSILKALPAARGTAVDISTRALEISRKNAITHLVANRLTLLHSNIFESVPVASYDAVVSNPPYIALADVPELQPEVRDFEPILALTDGGDGLSIIRNIIWGSTERLKPGGRLMLEIGFGQSEAVRKLFAEDTWNSLRILEDLQQIPRVLMGVRN